MFPAVSSMRRRFAAGALLFMTAIGTHAQPVDPLPSWNAGASKARIVAFVQALVQQPKVAFIDDKAGKPVGIQKAIGKRPIAAFGNSDGDFQMLEWTTSAPGTRLGLVVHHDDAEREYAYDRKSPFGKLDRRLDEASSRGWTLVSMKDDWKQVHAPAR